MFHYKKFLVLLLVSITFATHCFAQRNKLPPFQMTMIDSQIFRARDLPFGKSILIIYFIPDCKHCQDLTKFITSNRVHFINTSIVWISYYPIQTLHMFCRKNNLLNVKNYYIGTEGENLFLKSYYQLKKLPFIALYNKQGDLIHTYFSESDTNKLIIQLKKLQ